MVKCVNYLNGKLVSGGKVDLAVLEPGLFFGWGVFETLRSYKGKIVYLDGHLKRARHGCKLIKMDPSFSCPQIKKTIKKAVKLTGEDDCKVKIVFFRNQTNTSILVSAKKYIPAHPGRNKSGFCACVVSIKKDDSSVLSGIKSLNYLPFQLAYLEAKEKGFDEGLMLNPKGMLVEGARSNAFAGKNSKLIPPSLDSGCLAGITRKAIFDIARRFNIKFMETNIRPANLTGFDEVFLTNSLIGVMPLVMLGDKKISRGLPGELTRFIQKKYSLLPENIDV